MSGAAILTAITLTFTICCLAVVAYWMRGAALYSRSSTAYLRGDMAEGDRLAKRARCWSVGTGTRGKP